MAKILVVDDDPAVQLTIRLLLERAGHSVDVLLRVYAKCISGQQDEAKRRIEEATRPRDDRWINQS